MITEQRHYWRSFAGGELSEEMYGRPDLAKNQTGLSRCYNFSVTPQGSLVKRGGSRFVDVANNAAAQLDTFVRDDGEGFLLEFGHQYVRVRDSDGDVRATLITPFGGTEMFRLGTAQFANDFTVTHQNVDPCVLRRLNDSSWTFSPIAFNATLNAAGGLVVTANEITAMDPGDPRIQYRYVVTAVDSEGTESAPSGEAFNLNVLRVAGNNNTITWTAVPNAVRYNVYGARDNSSFGFIGYAETAAFPGFVDDNINPDFFSPPPAAIVDLKNPGDRPSVVAFHEQRAIFAASTSEPQSFWASGLAGFSYFKASEPPLDDHAFTYQISTKKAAPIRHVLALRDILFFTGSGVHRVYSDAASFNPGSVSAIQVSATGAAPYIRPQEAGNSILYPAARGEHLHALRYDTAGEGYQTEDVSIVAAHLIDGYSWVQTAMQNAPYPVWYGLRSDGIIIGLTYVAEQQVWAWFQIELPGAFVTSIAVVPEGKNDYLYVIAQRSIEGVGVAYIEKIEAPINPLQEQQEFFFVDSGVTYNGASTTTIDGLDHLEGEEVVALADGQPVGPFTVTGGEIQLDVAAEVVHVGKSYAAEAETLPLAYQTAGLGVGVAKIPSAVHVRMKRSEGIQAGTDYDHLYPLLPDASSLIGDPVEVRSGVHQISIDGEWNKDAIIVIKQETPLPATITGIALDFAGAG